MPIPVQRAEAFYLPPPPMPATGWDQVAPAERVWRWAEHKQQRRLRPPDGFLIGHRLYARINHGRWVADCPCASAQVVTPDDARLACTECGAGWFLVVFPEDVAAVEAEMEPLLPHERNWWHDDDPSWDRPPSDAAMTEDLTPPGEQA